MLRAPRCLARKERDAHRGGGLWVSFESTFRPVQERAGPPGPSNCLLGIACAVVEEDVRSDEDEDEEQGGEAELLLRPVKDQVCEMDANKRVAPAGATHHGRVLIDHHVAHSSAQDSGIEHDEHPKVTVHALQRDAEKDVQDHIHQHVDEANMGELVGEPPVDLRPVIFASRPYEAQVRAHILERVQAGLGAMML